MLVPRQDRLTAIIERYFGIGDEDADALLAELETIDIAGGEWLFRQGDRADAIYFVVRGRLQVWIESEAAHEEPRLLGEIAPGESVGEIGLLTGGVRTAGIRSIRDSQLLRLEQTVFERFAAAHPSLVLQLAGGVAARLSERTRRGPSGSRHWTTVALLPLDDGPWFTEFCQRLITALDESGSTLCLTAANLREHGAPDHGVNEGISDALRHWLDAREDDHELILYVADPGDTRWTRLCLRQSDITVLVADAAADPRPRSWEPTLFKSPSATSVKRALLLRHASPSSAIDGTARWLEDRSLDFHWHVRGEHASDVGRLARILCGRAVGLVLGAGAARGFAEIGAYRALHEAGVPIDWVGGASIGGIIGAAIARDRGPDYVIAASREAFVKGKPFSDYTIPVLSVIRGRRMERLLQHYLDGNIEDLPIPYFCVSTLLDTGDLRLHEEGPVWRALRATAAMPGLLPPAVVDQRLAIDGAVTNNLPVDVMQRKPVGQVVAVTVGAAGHVRAVDYADLPSPWSVLRRRVLPVGKKYRVPGLIATMLKSSEIGTAARMRELGRQADLLLRPPVERFGLTDVGAFDQIVTAGYDDARVRIAAWQEANDAP